MIIPRPLHDTYKNCVEEIHEYMNYEETPLGQTIDPIMAEMSTRSSNNGYLTNSRLARDMVTGEMRSYMYREKIQ